MKIEIKNRWTDAVIFSHEVEENTMAITVLAALAAGADLICANLSRADLSGSDLRGSNLRDADLSGSDLRGSDLRGSDLSGSNLRGSNLRGSDLSGSNLCGSDLTPIRDDIWAVLSLTPLEVPALIAALKDGRIDGSTYSGACSCLVGTLAAARSVNQNGINGLSPNSSRPAERFFMGIREGDTPETNQFSALALKWSQEWLDRMVAAFAPVSA
jgi:hypothetical protein